MHIRTIISARLQIKTDHRLKNLNERIFWLIQKFLAGCCQKDVFKRRLSLVFERDPTSIAVRRGEQRGALALPWILKTCKIYAFLWKIRHFCAKTAIFKILAPPGRICSPLKICMRTPMCHTCNVLLQIGLEFTTKFYFTRNTK